MEKLKLTKLLYLVERKSIADRVRPMLYDEYYSLKDGPICSNALNGLNMQPPDIWSKYVVAENTINRSCKSSDIELDHLSSYDLELLDEVWIEFGGYTSSQIRNWTHENCQEYTEVKSGRIGISLSSIAAATGVDASVLRNHVSDHRSYFLAIAD